MERDSNTGPLRYRSTELSSQLGPGHSDGFESSPLWVYYEFTTYDKLPAGLIAQLTGIADLLHRILAQAFFSQPNKLQKIVDEDPAGLQRRISKEISNQLNLIKYYEKSNIPNPLRAGFSVIKTLGSGKTPCQFMLGIL